MKYVVCLHLYIPWKFGERGLLPAELGGRVCLFVFLFVCHATMLGTESLDGAYTHWTWKNGHKPPGQKSPQAKDPPDKSTPGQKSPPGPGHPTSGDIFYCSGSRQLNHSSFSFYPHDAMRRSGICDSDLSVCLSVHPLQPVFYQNGKSSWFLHHLIAPWFQLLARYDL